MSERAIWVVVEHDEGQEKGVTHELLSQGRTMADGLGVELQAIVLGSAPEEMMGRLSGHPHRILCLDSPGLAPYSADGYVAALHGVVLDRKPMMLLSGATLTAMDFMPKLAARLQVGMVSEVTGLEVTGEGTIRVRRPVHGGRFFVDMEQKGSPPYLLAARPRAFPRTRGTERTEREVLPVDLPETALRTRVLGRTARPGGARDLTEAAIVAAGGRGMKSPENFALIEELAQLLGGVVGASRAVVDSKWRPSAEQVGKSGRTVSPELYLALGISGAVHHIMGMDSSKVVVAVNSDPKALIFNYADYGIVDDLFQVIPAMLDEIKRQ